ncbi:solute carrier family 28 member 3-like isoform X1 [Polistes fuscatus]|uniref:solute carrier family 28 member 3-like isoform X1 n=2 Tax=Polistes fuscatus TaxID=30207 RepID=UPI001CA9DF26|nr:solute carrier family 28 member 3-like isoform X1 [Polistes fuscatus]
MPGIVNTIFEESNEVENLENGSKNMKPCEKEEEDNESRKKFDLLVMMRNAMEAYFSKHRRIFKFLGLVLLNSLVVVYFVFATNYWVKTKESNDCGYCWCTGYGMLLLLLCFIYGGLFYYLIVKRYFGKFILHLFRPVERGITRLQKTRFGSRIFGTVIYVIILIAIVVFLIFDTIHSTERLISGLGVLILLLLGWLFSKHPAHINWRPVLSGMIMQFLFGLLTIRWTVGRAIFECISNKITTFMNYSKEGDAFIFSEELVEKGIFAFSVLPVIFFFSSFIQILYYLGVMGWVVMKFGWGLQFIMGTTICESLNSAANTFIGMTESLLLIKPYVSKLTSSEIHAIMCAGLASVSGSVFAAYVNFGADPAHLLIASVMSAPAALCYAKLFYPETEKSLTNLDNIQLEKSDDSGIMEAASNGALAAIPIILGIIANMIAFISVVAFINGFLFWLGELLGFSNWTFEFFLSKIFMPLSWIMGVPWNDCEKVGYLIGLKTVVNEFIAYKELGKFKKLSEISKRSETIATYAICGFSNPAAVGIMMGALCSIAPNKKKQIAPVAIRAFISGSAVCFLTASVAGMLIEDNNSLPHANTNDVISNYTLEY